MFKKIFLFLFFIFIFLLNPASGREKPEGTPASKATEVPKNYVYFIKRGGIFRYEEGYREKEEPYLTIGMKKSDIIYLNDIKTLDSVIIDYSDNFIKNIWVISPSIKTAGGLGPGSSMDTLRKFQSVAVGSTLEAYSPPYSGITFCSVTTPGMVDMVLISDTSISNSNNLTSSSSAYTVNSGYQSVKVIMDEIISTLYTELNMTPCLIQDIILLPTRKELGEMWSIFSGTNKPVTSFCVNDRNSSVIYVLYEGAADYKFKGILAHEYAHVWHYRAMGRHENTFIAEGFAEWIRYHYSKEHFEYPSDPEYTEGLNFFLDLEKKKGKKGVFKYLLN